MTDRPVGLQPEQVTTWLEGHVEDKRHKRRAAEVYRLFMEWGKPHIPGFKQVAPLVATGEMPRANFAQDKEKAVAYVLERYSMGPIASLLLWTVIKALVTKLVFLLFDQCLAEPDTLVVYYQTKESKAKDELETRPLREKRKRK